MTWKRQPNGQIFYNDGKTNRYTLGFDLPVSPGQQSPAPELVALRKRYTDLEDICGKQSTKLVRLAAYTEELQNLLQSNDVPYQTLNENLNDEEAARRKQQEALVVDFEDAQINWNQRDVEHSSNDKIIFDSHMRCRRLSCTRDNADPVSLSVTMRILVDSREESAEEISVMANVFDNFTKLRKFLEGKVCIWAAANASAQPAAGLQQARSSKYAVLTLEEDGFAACETRAPTRIMGDDADASKEWNYRSWYERNVVKGRLETYSVAYKLDLKSGEFKLNS